MCVGTTGRLVYDEELDATILVPVSSAADFPIVEDVDLSWEQFMVATSRMISCMVRSDWSQDGVDMFVEFWSNILNHQWRYSDDEFSQRALLVYQGIQRANAGTSP